MFTSTLNLKKFLALPIVVAPLVLGLGGVALAASPTSATPVLPSDQIALTGVCLSPVQVTAAADQALSLYVVGGAPAGVIVNGTWMPAGMVANFELTAPNNGCPNTSLPIYGALRPADQISINGSCLSIPQVEAAAQDSLGLYTAWGAPAGVIVNGTWVPAGIAANPGGAINSSGCALA